MSSGSLHRQQQHRGVQQQQQPDDVDAAIPAAIGDQLGAQREMMHKRGTSFICVDRCLMRRPAMPQANRPSFRGVLYAGVGLTAIAALETH